MKRNHLWPLVIVCAVVSVSLLLAGNGKLWGQSGETEPLASENPSPYVFLLQIGNQTVARYTECSGLGSSNDIEQTVVETDDGRLVRQKTPGALEWPNTVLRGKNLSDSSVWSWRGSFEAGFFDQAMQDGVIRVVDVSTLETVARWEFQNGWVASLTFGSEGEELVIVHDGLSRDDGKDYEPPR